MTQSHVFRFDLNLIKEPDDLWARLFFAWLKNIAEQNAATLQQVGALQESVTRLNEAVAKIAPEPPAELQTAMDALQEVQSLWAEQSARSLDNVEKMAVIAKQIVASQQSD